jgi:hypothetical protein
MVMRLVPTVAQALGTEAEQREQVIQVSQALGLSLLGGRQAVAAVLLIEQVAEPLLHSLGETKLRQVAWHLHFQLDGLRHIRFPFLRRNLAEPRGNVQAWNQPIRVHPCPSVVKKL